MVASNLSHPLVLNTISPMKLNGNFCWDKLPVGSCDIYGRNNMDSYDLKAPSAILLSSAMSRAWLWTLQKCVETNDFFSSSETKSRRSGHGQKMS